MSRNERLDQAESAERRSARIRANFGLHDSRDAERVRDWLQSTGAVPCAIFVIALLVYAALSLVGAFSS